MTRNHGPNAGPFFRVSRDVAENPGYEAPRVRKWEFPTILLKWAAYLSLFPARRCTQDGLQHQGSSVRIVTFRDGSGCADNRCDPFGKTRLYTRIEKFRPIQNPSLLWPNFPRRGAIDRFCNPNALFDTGKVLCTIHARLCDPGWPFAVSPVVIRPMPISCATPVPPKSGPGPGFRSLPL